MSEVAPAAAEAVGAKLQVQRRAARFAAELAVLRAGPTSPTAPVRGCSGAVAGPRSRGGVDDVCGQGVAGECVASLGPTCAVLCRLVNTSSCNRLVRLCIHRFASYVSAAGRERPVSTDACGSATEIWKRRAQNLAAMGRRLRSRRASATHPCPSGGGPMGDELRADNSKPGVRQQGWRNPAKPRWRAMIAQFMRHSHVVGAISSWPHLHGPLPLDGPCAG